MFEPRRGNGRQEAQACARATQSQHTRHTPGVMYVHYLMEHAIGPEPSTQPTAVHNRQEGKEQARGESRY